MGILTSNAQVERARTKWQYRGEKRPAFAVIPQPHQESVWDFPRPPVIEPVASELRVECDGQVLARTSGGNRVLETAGAPTYYFSPEDVDRSLAYTLNDTYHCEWKGFSQAVSTTQVQNSGWVLTAVYPEFAQLLGWYAFYPQAVACFIGSERVSGQPGGYYGGWVDSRLVGPIKGEPGTEAW